MATVVPAPAGTGDIAGNFARVGQQLGQGLSELGSSIRRRREERKQKELLAVQQQEFQRVMQAMNPQQFEQFAPGVGPPAPVQQPSFNNLGNITNPGLQNFLLQKAHARAFQPQQPDFTLGDTRFSGRTNQPIATNPKTPTPAPPRAGALQVSGANDPSGLPQGTVFQADPQGNVKIISEPGGEGLSASDKAKLAISQGKEFRDTSTVKNFRTVETMERGIQSALRVALNPKTKSKAFADQALVIGFNKLLDPSSVVRESEFARTPQGIALFNRLEAGVEKIVKGGVGITNADRQALASMSAKLLNESKRSFNSTFGDFEARANELGLNTRVVFGKQIRQSVTNDSAPSRASLVPADLDNMSIEQMQSLLPKQ